MKKYKVYGKVMVEVIVDVEAKNKKEAIDKAYDECTNLSSYTGNGGWNKMVGVSADNVNIECEDDVRYTLAEVQE